MPREPSLRKVRKGTRSCVDCRRRKVRCIWASDQAEICRNCEEHMRRCVSQNEVEEDADAYRLTSRERIHQLEGEVTNIWAYVRKLEQRLDASASPSTHNERAPLVQQQNVEGSLFGDLSPNPPTYLQELFGSASLDSQPSSRGNQSTDATTEALFAEKRQLLQRLLPSKQNVAAIARHSSLWLNVYHGLFPTLHSVKNLESLLSLYDQASKPYAHPATVAALLLALAITIRQLTPDQSLTLLDGIGNGPQYVRDVQDAVEQTIVNDEALAATTDGIEISLSFIRLQLVHINVKKAWLMLRRVISLAEMIGLPRIASRFASAHPDKLRVPVERENNDNAHAGAVLWQTICAVDRIVSMLFNLPIGTTNYHFAEICPVDAQGQVVQFAYLCRLADIASHVQEVDDIIGTGQSTGMVVERVLKADEELRALASLPPLGWWENVPEQTHMSPDHFVQCWHQYITMRTHLHLALQNSQTGEYAYSYIACTEASKKLVARYVSLRLNVSAGFFAWRIFDLQVLAAAVFLLHSRDRVAMHEVQRTDRMIHELLSVMSVVSELPFGECAREGAVAIRSLMALLDNNTSSASEGLALSIPLLGKLHVRRSTNSEYQNPLEQHGFTTISEQMPNFAEKQATHSELPPTANGGISANLPPDSASWWVEIPTEFPFLSDDFSGIDQWSSFSILDGM